MEVIGSSLGSMAILAIGGWLDLQQSRMNSFLLRGL